MMARSSGPTLNDVARRSGVSATTVSYVLHGRRNGASRISEETRQRVQTAKDELSYFPNQMARGLRRQRTDRICLLLSRLGSPYIDALVGDVQRVAASHGYSTVLVVEGSEERNQLAVSQLQRRLADALLDGVGLDASTLALLAQRGTAVVTFSNRLGPDGFDVIRGTEAEGCYQAVRHLIATGHHRIGLLTHDEHPDAGDERFTGYCRALAECGIPLDEHLIRGGALNRGDAYQGAAWLLAQPNPPTAIFAESDIGAISAIWAARDRGLTVPNDLALIGVGNVPEGRVIQPTLSTVGPVSMDFSDVADLLLSRVTSTTNLEGRELVRPWVFYQRESA